MASNIVRFTPCILEPIASITNSYTQLGSPFDHAMRLLHFQNDTNGSYMISFDGVTNNFPVLTDSFVLYDLTSDQDSNEMFRYEKGTQLWIKYLIPPTVTTDQTDILFVSLVYGKGE